MSRVDDIIDFNNSVIPESVANRIGSIVNSVNGQSAASERAFEQQKELWNMETEYNSPKAQMQRLKDAGLNPDLAYGNGAASSSSSVPSVGIGSGNASPVQAALSMFNESRLAAAEIRKREAEADFAKEQADEIRHKRPQNDERFDWERTMNIWNEKIAEFKGYEQYQRGLSLALDNFSKGYRPSYQKQDGYTSYKSWEFGEEFYNMLNESHNIVKDVALQYDIDEYDLKYLQRMFEAMVENDKQAFEYNANRLRSTSAVQEFKADNKWFQFLDYFVDKLSGVANGAASAYYTFQRGRFAGKKD